MPVAPHSNRRCTNLLRTDCRLAVDQRQQISPIKPLACLDAVGVAGFEPTASSSRTKRATKLRHTPLEATTAYRTDPAIRQSGLPGQLSGPNGHPPCHLRDSVDTGTAAGATQITPGLAGDLCHSSAWNKRDVGGLK
jgi:hypothetical protein